MSKPRLLADENIPRTVVAKLREHGYDVLAVCEVVQGAKDEEVVGLAVNERRVILTFDKEFGRFALTNQNIPGVILLRISPRCPEYVAQRVLTALTRINNLYGKLIVIRERTIKVIPIEWPHATRLEQHRED